MDGFIRDIITITVDDKHWIERAKSADILVIHTLLRPLHPSEPLKREAKLSFKENWGGRKTGRARNMPKLGYTHSLPESIPTNREANSLGN